MKGWHLNFDDEILDGAKNCEVEISHVEEGEIIAKVDGFEVIAPIVFHSPHHVFCNCKSKYPCKHEAALIFYLEEEMGEHSFACSFVEKIARVLGDDLAVSHDSWYNLAEDFMEYVYILEDSIYLTSDERKSLESVTSEIISYL